MLYYYKIFHFYAMLHNKQNNHDAYSLLTCIILLGLSLDDRYLVRKKQSGRQSVPIFGIMNRDEIGPLFRIEGTFTYEKYLDLLNQDILSYIEENYSDGHFYYYQDNSPIHHARHVRRWFDVNVPAHQLFRTPAKSFDINPIENVWAMAKINVAKNGLYNNSDDLWLAITDAWADLRANDGLAHILVDSVPRRLQAIINNQGSHTKY